MEQESLNDVDSFLDRWMQTVVRAVVFLYEFIYTQTGLFVSAQSNSNNLLVYICKFRRQYDMYNSTFFEPEL